MLNPQIRMTLSGLALVLAVAAGNHGVGAAPPPKGIELAPLGVYRTGFYDEGAVEISAYDPDTARAFVTFAARPRVDVIDLSDPAVPSLAFRIDLTPWGADAHATSVAVRDGVRRGRRSQGEDDTAPGKVLFFDADGELLSAVTVGALPDMLTFTPNGRLRADGQRRAAASETTRFDPEGSVSIIDMTRRRRVADRRRRDDGRLRGVQRRGARPVDSHLRPWRDRRAGPRARVHRGLARFEDRVGHAAGEQRARDHRPEGRSE